MTEHADVFNGITNVSSSVTTLETILKQRTYIPVFQRDYDWTKKQADDLFNDMLTYINELEKPGTKYHSAYLFGSVIIFTSDGVRWVIDGQQRLISSSLFIAAARDLFNSIHVKTSSSSPNFEIVSDHEKECKNLLRDYNVNPQSAEKAVWIVPKYEKTKLAFFKIVYEINGRKSLGPNPSSNSVKHMVDVYDYFYNRLFKEIQLKQEDKKMLKVAM